MLLPCTDLERVWTICSDYATWSKQKDDRKRTSTQNTTPSNTLTKDKQGLNAIICQLNSLVKFKFCNEIYINLKNITRFLMVFIFFSKNNPYLSDFKYFKQK